MSIEVEQKYRIADTHVLLENLAAQGAESKHIVQQVDMYYSHPNRDFAATDEALRIRRVGESNFITYKGPKLDETTKTRREIEMPLASGSPSADGYDKLLQALSFERVAEVSKIRQSYKLQREDHAIEVALDQVKGLGDFVELEIVVSSDDAIETAKQRIATLADELQLAGTERRSYLELLLADQSGN